MPRRELISLHLASADGYDEQPPLLLVVGVDVPLHQEVSIAIDCSIMAACGDRSSDAHIEALLMPRIAFSLTRRLSKFPANVEFNAVVPFPRGILHLATRGMLD
jgi:hypothetical protein